MKISLLYERDKHIFRVDNMSEKLALDLQLRNLIEQFNQIPYNSEMPHFIVLGTSKFKIRKKKSMFSFRFILGNNEEMEYRITKDRGEIIIKDSIEGTIRGKHEYIYN